MPLESRWQARRVGYVEESARASERTECFPGVGADDAPSTPHNLRPQPVPTSRIIHWGLGAWGVALLAAMAFPPLHTGDRQWWPWACVTGLVLGLLGLGYVRAGRGNAADAH